MNKKSLAVVNYRIRLKQRLIEYKGGKCQKCGYNRPVPGAYHFHHRSDKSFNINACTFGFERMKAEVDKCDLLCANCHAEVHDEAWVDRRQQAFIVKWQRREKRKCPVCRSLFLPNRPTQIYCSRGCQHKSMIKMAG